MFDQYLKKIASVSGATARLSIWKETWWCSTQRSRSRTRACTPVRRPFITTQPRSLSRWTSCARTGCSVRTRCVVFSTYVTFTERNTDYINILMQSGLALICLGFLVAWQPDFLFACVSSACLQSCGAFSHRSALHFSAGFTRVHLVGLSHCDRRRCHLLGMLVSQMVQACVPCKIWEKQDAWIVNPTHQSPTIRQFLTNRKPCSWTRQVCVCMCHHSRLTGTKRAETCFSALSDGNSLKLAQCLICGHPDQLKIWCKRVWSKKNSDKRHHSLI